MIARAVGGGFARSCRAPAKPAFGWRPRPGAPAPSRPRSCWRARFAAFGRLARLADRGLAQGMTMKPELLILAPMMPRVLETLERDYEAHRLWSAPDQAALLAEHGPRIRAIATTGGRGAEGALISALPKLEIIACYGVGVDAIDLPTARARGIKVTNTPDVLTDDVADLAMALLLATARRICAADRHVREGRWLKGDMPLTRKFSGSRV